MPEAPLISVITIFFNAEKYIEEAINSVINQTYNNWELILVDDGSFDSSRDIAEKYGTEYPEKIILVEHPNKANKGMSASRNLGFSRSKGEYITFLDADDVLLVEKLEKQLEIFQKNNKSDIVIGATKFWFSWNSNNNDYIQTIETSTKLYPKNSLLKRYLKYEAVVPCLCSLLIKREAFKDIGGFEEEFKGMYEDQVFYSKAAATVRCFVDDGCYELYRQHAESCYSKAKEDKQVLMEAKLKYLSWLKKYLIKNDLYDSEYDKIISSQTWLTRHEIMNKYYRMFKKIARKNRINN